MSKTYIQNLITTDPRFAAILALPDEQFDKEYDVVKPFLLKSFNAPEARAAAARSVQMVGKIDREKGQQSLNEMIEEIKNLEGYTEKKKQFLIDILTQSANLTMDIAENPRDRIEVKIYKINPEAKLPIYAHPTDAGADICAVEETKLEAGETKIVKTGLVVAIPAGYEIQVRPRSGLSLKSGLRIANSPGTIDSEYRGEIGIIITNTGDIPYVIEKGMKIAQMVIAPTPMIKWIEVDSEADLGETDRGSGGFGSTDLATKS